MENKRELEIQKLVERTHKIAVESLRNFFVLLDLNPDAFNHLYEIEMDFDDNENLASYSPIDNKISLNREVFNEALYDIEDYPNRQEEIEVNLAISMVHEMIHANRTVLIDNGVTTLSLERFKKEEQIRLIQQKQGYDLDVLRYQLSQMLDKPYIKEFKKYIPFNIKEKNGVYEVLTYNLITKNYEKFSSNDFCDDYSEDKDKFLSAVGFRLNNTEYEESDIIYSFTGKDTRPVVACDYVDDYKPFFTDEDLSLSFEEINDLEEDLNYEYEQKVDKLEGKDALEESLTETLAIITIMSRKQKTLDLDIVTTKIEENEECIDLKVAAKLIRALGKDTIRWFMTSAYEPYYQDKFSTIFEEQYNCLLYDFSNLYSASQYEENDEKTNKYEINDVNKIIKQKVLKRK